ncbi:MAG: cell division protein FtsL [Deltaproteobacteria bacterium CG11_big_fil_rev_8_21_14_0_20_47_16]|nr:MAG: cell division protein FtsL [Deltaproteobacteria bacterium CG11_big_fil_rev_8_21_14_0_20_47_16]
MISKRAQMAFTPKMPEVTWESRPKVVMGQGVAARGRAVHRRLLGRMSFFVLAVFVCCLFYVWSRVQVVQLRYSMSEIQKKVSNYKDDIRRFETEVTRLKSPQRLEVFAKDGLHMVLPTSQNIVIVKEGPTEGDHGTSSAQSR